MQAESERRVGDTVGETVGDSEIKHCKKSTVPIVIVSGVPSVHEVQIDEIVVPTTHGFPKGSKSSGHCSGLLSRYLSNTNTGAPKLEYVSLIVFYLNAILIQHRTCYASLNNQPTNCATTQHTETMKSTFKTSSDAWL